MTIYHHDPSETDPDDDIDNQDDLICWVCGERLVEIEPGQLFCPYCSEQMEKQSWINGGGDDPLPTQILS